MGKFGMDVYFVDNSQQQNYTTISSYDDQEDLRKALEYDKPWVYLYDKQIWLNLRNVKFIRDINTQYEEDE